MQVADFSWRLKKVKQNKLAQGACLYENDTEGTFR